MPVSWSCDQGHSARAIWFAVVPGWLHSIRLHKKDISPKVSAANGITSRPEIDPEITSLADYATGDIAGECETFLAGCRNTNESSLSAIDQNKEAYCKIIGSVYVGKFRGELKTLEAGY